MNDNNMSSNVVIQEELVHIGKIKNNDKNLIILGADAINRGRHIYLPKEEYSRKLKKLRKLFTEIADELNNINDELFETRIIDGYKIMKEICLSIYNLISDEVSNSVNKEEKIFEAMMKLKDEIHEENFNITLDSFNLQKQITHSLRGLFSTFEIEIDNLIDIEQKENNFMECPKNWENEDF